VELELVSVDELESLDDFAADLSDDEVEDPEPPFDDADDDAELLAVSRLSLR
jgi:hypothetical protein